jgi:hypothetical protein
VHLRIAGQEFSFERAALVAYHCAADEADWNLELVRDGETLWLSGTVAPAPASGDALAGAVAMIDPRALDELAGALLGRPLTLFPATEPTLALSCTARGVRLATRFTCDWDRALDTFPDPAPIDITIDIDAELAALHPGRLP